MSDVINRRSTAMLRAFLIALVLGVPFAAAAKDAPPEPVVVKDVAVFVEHQMALRADLEGNSKKFSHIKDSSKRELYRAQDKMLDMLKGKKTIDDLSEYEKVEVYNLQEEIASILVGAEDDRQVCERSDRMGSHFKDVKCMSKRDRDRARDDYRDLLLFPHTCSGGTCSSGTGSR